jgi:hypothetical protein
MRARFWARWGLGVLCALVSALPGAAFAQGEKRVALVIGNSTYRNVPVLTNPINDAQDIAGTFERLGFTVRRVTNATYDEMRRGLLEFGRQARGADVAIVFFAGHGIEVGGENWLIPIDAELRSDVDVDHEAMGLRSVLPLVEGAAKLGLVILDACRNNPFAAKMQRTIRTRSVARGLAGVEPSGNVLVAYAAKDGTTANDGDGRNSPFTSSLLKHLETPGLEINFLFRNVRDDVIRATRREQQPFVYGSLSKDAIYLKAPPVVLPPPPPGPGPDEVTWSFLKETSDPAALKRFIEQYPKSPLRAQAETRVAALAVEAGRAAAAREEEAAWALLGGSNDPASLRRFIEQYPKSALRPQAEARMAKLAEEATKAAAARAEETAWGFLQGSKDPASLRRFLEQFPNSPRHAEVEQRIATIAAEQRAAAQDVEQKMAALAAEAQQARARPAGPAPEDVAWSLVKDSKDPDQFRLFLEQFPKSARRPEAERRIAAIAAEQRAAALALEQRMASLRTETESTRSAAGAPVDAKEVARSLQLELRRVGCFDGAINGEFGTPSRDALRNFARLAAVSLPDNELSGETLSVIRKFDKRICPLSCKPGERAEDERCIRIVCPSGQFLKDGACVAKPGSEPKKRVTETPEARPAPKRPAASAAPAGGGGGGGGGKCFSFQGRRFCE